jgi:GNAT superfamily N-acetyltransferase
MTQPPLFVEDQPAPGDLRFLEDQIIQHNYAQTGADDGRALAIFLRGDPDEIIAGLSGYTWAGMCEIEFLWVRPDLQDQGLGRRLLHAAEQEARQRGCSIIILGSYSFQAPDFYRKNGYKLVGQVDDCPPKHSNYYFKKNLAARQDSYREADENPAT